MSIELLIAGLPPSCRFSIVNLSQAATRREHGPWGNGGSGTGDPPAHLPEWHATIMVAAYCGCCDREEIKAWCKGHGHTSVEATNEAFKNFHEIGVKFL